MTQYKILLADSDETYLASLEKYFIEYYTHSAELHLITEKDYLELFFSEPQTFDLLIIDEKLYNQSFSRHNIKNIFLLTEGRTDTALQPIKLYKYSSAKEILNYIVRRTGINRSEDSRNEAAKLIMVYSPVGGSGQTTIARCLTAAMQQSLSKAVYISGDSLQVPVGADAMLPAGIERSIRSRSSYVYDKIKPFIVRGHCNTVPVFPSSLVSLGMEMEDILFLCEEIRGCGDYDYVFLDGGSGLDQGVTKAMAAADYVIIVTNQDKTSNRKLATLLKNIDCSDIGHYLIVCNKYSERRRNYIADGIESYDLTVAYVEKSEMEAETEEQTEAEDLIKKISQLESVKKIVQLLM